VGGHLRGTETGNSLGYLEMGVRVYLPSLGRFLQEDPVEGGSASGYEYCFGDPVNCWDLDGDIGWRDLIEELRENGPVCAVALLTCLGVATGSVTVVGCALVCSYAGISTVGRGTTVLGGGALVSPPGVSILWTAGKATRNFSAGVSVGACVWICIGRTKQNYPAKTRTIWTIGFGTPGWWAGTWGGWAKRW
ncbi:MAG: RHS repeat-associated core domain-containing protein, partial [Acidimicrobiia bacterium]